MTKKQFVTDLLPQARSVLNSWGQIDDQLVFGPLNSGVLAMAVKRANAIDETIIDLENKLTDLRNQREASSQDLWNIVKRVRAAFKGIFGDDSAQYEMVGGKRLSERKSARRTQATIL